jgi:hypothetical protein
MQVPFDDLRCLAWGMPTLDISILFPLFKDISSQAFRRDYLYTAFSKQFYTMKLTTAVFAASIALATAAEFQVKARQANPPSKHQGPSKQPPKPHDPPRYPPGPPHHQPGKPSKPTKPGKPTKTIGTGTSASSTAAPTGYPPVDSAALQAAIDVENLRLKAQDLEDIAYATPDRNRVIGSEGHNNTVAYLVESIEALGDYWTVYRQPFTALYSHVDGELTVDGATTEPSIFEYSPGGSFTAELVRVDNLGCEAADYPAEVSGNIALVQRGTCEFGLKSALAGAAGAVGAIIYNNAPEPLGSGTLGPPPRPEGDYVPTVGVNQANATSWIERITGGEAIEVTLDIESDLYNITV